MNLKSESIDPIPMFTKKGLLEHLGEIERRLYMPKVTREIKKQPEEVRIDFVATRLALTAIIRRLKTARMREIREKLDQQTPELKKGILDLGESLKNIENASRWAGAINGIIKIISRIIEIF